MINESTKYQRELERKARRGESTFMRVGAVLSGSHHNASLPTETQTRASLIAELENQQRARRGTHKP